MLNISYYDSPCGQLITGEYGGRLVLCDWAGPDGSIRPEILRRLNPGTILRGHTPLLRQAAAQLDEYFSGRRRRFTLPLYTFGTDFQQCVWRCLLSVEYGHTATYGDIARRSAYPSAVRAVANAIGANALSIFIPCHRIVASNGPGGYAGGAEAKQLLLTLEAKTSAGEG